MSEKNNKKKTFTWAIIYAPAVSLGSRTDDGLGEPYRMALLHTTALTSLPKYRTIITPAVH